MLLLARKRDIFKKNTIARDMRNRSALRRFGKLTDLRGLQRHNHPERIQYAQDTIHPWPSRAVASNCLILVAESVEVSSRGQEQNSTSSPLFGIYPAFFRKQKRRGVECIYLLEAFDCPQRINANNSRPKRSCGINKNGFAM